jgi:PadR family transcriptional regulator, regulatory protein PadR
MQRKRNAKDEKPFAGCPCRGRNLQKLVQPLVLASLASGALHGYAITDRIAGRKIYAGGPPNYSAVYRLLRGMERKGIVTSRLVESSVGPARREYALTEAGRQCLVLWLESLAVYRKTIDSIMTLCRGADREHPFSPA